MCVILLFITTNIYRVLSASTVDTQKISHSLTILERLHNLLNVMINAETGQRGYIITKDKRFLDPYDSSIAELKGSMSPDTLLQIMPEHTKQVIELNRLIDAETTYLRKTISELNTGSNVDEITFVNGRIRMDSIRNSINFLITVEGKKLEILNREHEETNKEIINVLVLGFVACLILLISFYLMVENNSRIRNKIEEELRAAKNAAENAVHAKTHFLSTMSNEIRNPMNNVIGVTSLLLQTHLTDEQKKYAIQIHRSGVTLLSIINDSIDFSRIESGNLKLENVPFILKHCIEEVFSIIGSHSREVKVTYHIDSQIPEYIIGDITRLRQVLMNLVGNAIQFTESAFIHLDVKLLGREEDHLNLEFKINDAPLNEADVDEKPYTITSLEQEAMADVYKMHNTGLGLSIAARLIALMGGAVKVESSASGGSSFTFTIKVKPVAEATGSTAGSLIGAEAYDSELSKKIPLRILSVDDNEMSQVLLSSILMKMGYTASIARNGAEAVDLAVEEKFDLIFMDIYMPVMDGLEATRRIRQYYIKDDDPIIIALTANALLEEKDKYVLIGINDVITKPYKLSTIQNAILKSFKNKMRKV
jgi:signal transduction histidine kinase/ActR/RegA family two-component response regulator